MYTFFLVPPVYVCECLGVVSVFLKNWEEKKKRAESKYCTFGTVCHVGTRKQGRRKKSHSWKAEGPE